MVEAVAEVEVEEAAAAAAAAAAVAVAVAEAEAEAVAEAETVDRVVAIDEQRVVAVREVAVRVVVPSPRLRLLLGAHSHWRPR